MFPKFSHNLSMFSSNQHLSLTLKENVMKPARRSSQPLESLKSPTHIIPAWRYKPNPSSSKILVLWKIIGALNSLSNSSVPLNFNTKIRKSLI